MTREEALKILDLGHALPFPTAEMIRARFSAKVKAAHPDGGMLPSGGAREAGFRIKELKQARDVLLAAVDSTKPTDCVTCRGSGWVAVGFRQERCPRGC